MESFTIIKTIIAIFLQSVLYRQSGIYLSQAYFDEREAEIQHFMLSYPRTAAGLPVFPQDASGHPQTRT